MKRENFECHNLPVRTGEIDESLFQIGCGQEVQQRRIAMSELTLEREEGPDWVRLPLLTEDSGEILLVSREGGQLALPATVLLAVSRSLATIFDTIPLLSVVTQAVSLPVGSE